MKILKRILLSVALGVVVLAALAVWQIGGPRNVIGMLRYDQRQEGDLKVGDRAPDAQLLALDGRTLVRLKDSMGSQPLVLVFGSFT
jgi:hypothetical protein